MQFLRYPLLVVSIVSCSFAAEPSVEMMVKLNRDLRSKQESTNPYEKTPTVIAPSARVPEVRQKLSARISFLSDGQLTVMIPKGALIHSPPNHRISVREKIQGKLVEWNEFFLANRNAIRLEPVDADQLQGKKALDPKAVERVIQANFPTLASYQNRVVALPKSNSPSAP